VVSRVPHVHWITLSIRHSNGHLPVTLPALVHLVLQVKIVFERLTIFSGDRRESFDPIISNCLLVLILVAQGGLSHVIGDHVDISRQIDLVFCILEAIAGALGLSQNVNSRSGSARGRAGV